MSRRRHRDEDVAGAEDRNRRCRDNDGNVAGAMDRNDDRRRDDRRVVINADEVIIRADRVIVREENDRRDDHRRGCHRNRGDRRDPFWWV
jgi:hypothetical protein